jgi:UrcA family protein
MTALTAIAMLIAMQVANAASRSIVVNYGDLDLNTSTGRAELNDRLHTAASSLCSPVLARKPDSEPSVREHQILFRACVGRLADRAMARVPMGSD